MLHQAFQGEFAFHTVTFIVCEAIPRNLATFLVVFSLTTITNQTQLCLIDPILSHSLATPRTWINPAQTILAALQTRLRPLKRTILRPIFTMVQWSDLPIELRYRILQYVFVGTTISYSERRHATRYESNSGSLTLQLVSRSFAQRRDVVGAMLSTAALGLRTGLDLDLISANKRCYRGLLARLCTIAVTKSVTGLNQIPLSRLQVLLPRLSLIHVQPSRNLHSLCQIFPEILIADDPDTALLIELLKKQQLDDGRVHMI